MTKSGGANLLTKQYFYCKKLKSYGALWGCSSIAPPFPPPMAVAAGSYEYACIAMSETTSVV